jgi:exoribonuclease R
MSTNNQLYIIQINDRSYTSWNIENGTMDNFVLNPISEKLFNKDTFTLETSETASRELHIVDSPTRNALNIPCVLVLNNGKTYGRKSQNPKNKLLYKAIPNDSHLPAFLVPYEIKKLGFSKALANLYITITFTEWSNDQKHPYGIVNQVVGPVDELPNFCEYQLYCKELNISAQSFVKDAHNAIKKHSVTDTVADFLKERYPMIEDRTAWNVFSIDPDESKDFDDAFSIRELGDVSLVQVSVYIANVVLWLEALGLWSSFSKRVSTIYLPDKKRTMLPPILSDVLCSLQEKHVRIAFTMDVFISRNDMSVQDVKFVNTLVRVNKNYRYEEPPLLRNPNYSRLSEITRHLDCNSTYKYLSEVKDSHDVVAYWAIFMNAHCAKKLLFKRSGVFRKTLMKNNDVELPPDIAKIMNIWSGMYGEYTCFHENAGETSTRHETLNLESYVHITSPIRRVVDILNMIKFQDIYGMIPISAEAQEFYEKWTTAVEIEYINTSVRNIRKVQTACELLQMFIEQPELCEKEYNGYILDKGSVYLPELKKMFYMKIPDETRLYEKCVCKLYLFNDEETLKKKIRLQLG